MTEYVTIDELPDAVREQTDDLPWTTTGLDAGRIDKNECYGCDDVIYTVQSRGEWVELDKGGEDRGFVMYLSDSGAMPQALDLERAQEQPLACGYCRESMFDYGYSEIHAISGSEHAVGLLDSGIIDEHYMDQYDSIHRCSLWEQVLAVARGDDWDVPFPAITAFVADEQLEFEEGAMVNALDVYEGAKGYPYHENYADRDAFVDALREFRISAPVPVVLYGSEVFTNENAVDLVGEVYMEFLEERTE